MMFSFLMKFKQLKETVQVIVCFIGLIAVEILLVIGMTLVFSSIVLENFHP